LREGFEPMPRLPSSLSSSIADVRKPAAIYNLIKKLILTGQAPPI
jgi:hypothetical protein